MGRSYWFECSRCGCRAVVSGKPDRGPDFFTTTISCRDCKQLYDAVVKIRVPTPPIVRKPGSIMSAPSSLSIPPSFQAALTRLPATGIRKFRWKLFSPACPVSSIHRIDKWTDPGPCPKCGFPMERNPLPYRIWE